MTTPFNRPLPPPRAKQKVPVPGGPVRTPSSGSIIDVPLSSSPSSSSPLGGTSLDHEQTKRPPLPPAARPSGPKTLPRPSHEPQTTTGPLAPLGDNQQPTRPLSKSSPKLQTLPRPASNVAGSTQEIGANGVERLSHSSLSEVDQPAEVKRLGVRNLSPMPKQSKSPSPSTSHEVPPNSLATPSAKVSLTAQTSATPSTPTLTRPLAQVTKPSIPRPGDAKRFPSTSPGGAKMARAPSSSALPPAPVSTSPPSSVSSFTPSSAPQPSPLQSTFSAESHGLSPGLSPRSPRHDSLLADINLADSPSTASPIAVEVVPDPPARREKRVFIIEEILSTETTYVAHLQELRVQFMDPLRKVLSDEDMRRIFSNVEVLETLHSELLRDLKERWTNTQTIGDSLVRIIPFMKLYIDYINNYETSTKAIEHLSSKSRSFWSAMQKLGTEQWPGEQGMNSLRVTPIQRIPRYVLLLKDLKEHTSPDHTDYAKINEAFGSVSKMAEYINERKRQDYNLKRIAEVAAKLKGNLNQGLNLATDQTKSYSHHFKKKTIVKGTTCDLCKKLMVGLGEKVYTCKSCNYTAHGKCKAKVPASCTKPYEQALLIKPTRHIIREGRARHRKFLVQTGNRHVAQNVKSKECVYFIFNDALLIVYPFEDSTGEEAYEFDSLIKWRARGTGRYIEIREAADPKSLSVMSPRDLATHFLDVDTTDERASIIENLKHAVATWREAKKLDISAPASDGTTQKLVAPPDGIRLGLDDVVMLLKLWRTASFQISNTVPVRSQTEKEFTAYVIEIKFPSGSVSILKRYSQIHTLSKQLHKHYPAKLLPKMPEKKFFGNTATNFVQKRCAKLQTYFNDCTKLDKIFDIPEVLEFLTTSLAEKDNKGEESDEEGEEEGEEGDENILLSSGGSLPATSRQSVVGVGGPTTTSSLSPSSALPPSSSASSPSIGSHASTVGIPTLRQSQRPTQELPAPPPKAQAQTLHHPPLPPTPQGKPLPAPPPLQRQSSASSSSVSSSLPSSASSSYSSSPSPLSYSTTTALTPPEQDQPQQPQEHYYQEENNPNPNPNGLWMTSIEAFVAETETELSFGEGEAVLVIQQNHPEWWYGMTADGRAGYFPKLYVR